MKWFDKIFVALYHASYHRAMRRAIAAKDRKNLVIAIQLELKISALPAPMMPLAYVSPQWHVSSHKYKSELDL